MSAVIVDLKRRLEEKRKSIASKTAEIVQILGAIPEGAVDAELVDFVTKAHEDAKRTIEEIRNNGK